MTKHAPRTDEEIWTDYEWELQRLGNALTLARDQSSVAMRAFRKTSNLDIGPVDNIRRFIRQALTHIDRLNALDDEATPKEKEHQP